MIKSPKKRRHWYSLSRAGNLAKAIFGNYISQGDTLCFRNLHQWWPQHSSITKSTLHTIFHFISSIEHYFHNAEARLAFNSSFCEWQEWLYMHISDRSEVDGILRIWHFCFLWIALLTSATSSTLLDYGIHKNKTTEHFWLKDTIMQQESPKSQTTPKS